MAVSKQLVISNYIASNPGTTFNTVQLAQQLGVSLPTLLSYIKNHPADFAKVKHGWYSIAEQQIMGTFTDDGDYIPAPINPVELVTIIEDTPTSTAGPLVYIPNAPIPFPKTVETTTDETHVADVQQTANRPFDW